MPKCGIRMPAAASAEVQRPHGAWAVASSECGKLRTVGVHPPPDRSQEGGDPPRFQHARKAMLSKGKSRRAWVQWGTGRGHCPGVGDSKDRRGSGETVQWALGPFGGKSWDTQQRLRGREGQWLSRDLASMGQRFPAALQCPEERVYP